MTKEEAIKVLKRMKYPYNCKARKLYISNVERDNEALDMAIQALSQVSEIEENIIKYMKKYPNHVGNTDFWEGFYACRNVVLQLDDEEYVPKEQEPCDAISRDAVLKIIDKWYENKSDIEDLIILITYMSSVTQKSDEQLYKNGFADGYEQGHKDAEQKSGIWVEIDDEPHEVWECDHCGFVIDGSGCIEPYEYRDTYKYCPNCGACMKDGRTLDEFIEDSKAESEE